MDQCESLEKHFGTFEVLPMILWYDSSKNIHWALADQLSLLQVQYTVQAFI